MAIDIAKMKAKLDKVEGKNKGNDNKFFKPQPGTYDVRFLPSADGDPFKEYHIHYGLKSYGLLCSKRMFDEDCPICSFASALYRQGGEENEKQAKDLFASARFYSLVLVRGEEDKGPQIYGYSKTVYTSLLNLILDPDYGDITDPEKGFDIKLEYGKKPGAKFATTDLMPRRKESPLLGKKYDKVECDAFLADLPDLTDLFERRSHADLAAALEEFCNATSNDTTEGSTRYGTEDGATNLQDPDESSVEDAFRMLSE
jgi:hypothetical protein